MYKSIYITIFFYSLHVEAQTVRLLYQNDSVSFRGLSVVSDRIVWVSGSKGTVGRSTDGGKNWCWLRVPGFEQRDFRDIEAFNEHTALVMAIGEPANLLKTIDGGKSWQVVLSDSTRGMFLDAMDFNGPSGIVVGDPVDGRFFLARTVDSGNTWQQLPANQRPIADSGEACFASSGSNISIGKNGSYYFVTGGTRARFFSNNQSHSLPIVQGLQSTGANSLAVYYDNKLTVFAVAGGDFTKDKQSQNNSATSTNAGRNWTGPVVPPQGYRSSIIFLNKTTLLACGTSGIDLSKDRGSHWKKIADQSYHVSHKAKNGHAVFLAGAKGKIAVMEGAIY